MTKRIKELVNLVPFNSRVADIGCDHAFLIVELFRLKKIDFACAIDNKDGPIKNAIFNIKKNNLNVKCHIIKTDGLNFNLESKKIDTLVFAGLGGLNVIKIINDNVHKLKHIRYIISDIHRNNDKFKLFIEKLNFQVDNEILVVERKKKYNLCRYINKQVINYENNKINL